MLTANKHTIEIRGHSDDLIHVSLGDNFGWEIPYNEFTYGHEPYYALHFTGNSGVFVRYGDGGLWKMYAMGPHAELVFEATDPDSTAYSDIVEVTAPSLDMKLSVLTAKGEWEKVSLEESWQYGSKDKWVQLR